MVSYQAKTRSGLVAQDKPSSADLTQEHAAEGVSGDSDTPVSPVASKSRPCKRSRSTPAGDLHDGTGDCTPVGAAPANPTQELPSGDDRPKSKQLLTAHHKDFFLEAVCEWGRDFDSICTYMRKKIDGFVITKDQMRSFYYRLMRKLWRHLDKRVTSMQRTPKLELTILACLLELRKRGMLGVSDKVTKKLNEMIMEGSTCFKQNGRTVRIKIPSCKALKKIVEQKEVHVPQRLTIELIPKTEHALLVVRNAMQNPRLRLRVDSKLHVSKLIEFLVIKWKVADLHASNAVLTAMQSRRAPSTKQNGTVAPPSIPAELSTIKAETDLPLLGVQDETNMATADPTAAPVEAQPLQTVSFPYSVVKADGTTLANMYCLCRCPNRLRVQYDFEKAPSLASVAGNFYTCVLGMLVRAAHLELKSITPEAKPKPKKFPVVPPSSVTPKPLVALPSPSDVFRVPTVPTDKQGQSKSSNPSSFVVNRRGRLINRRVFPHAENRPASTHLGFNRAGQVLVENGGHSLLAPATYTTTTTVSERPQFLKPSPLLKTVIALPLVAKPGILVNQFPAAVTMVRSPPSSRAPTVILQPETPPGLDLLSQLPEDPVLAQNETGPPESSIASLVSSSSYTTSSQSQTSSVHSVKTVSTLPPEVAFPDFSLDSFSSIGLGDPPRSTLSTPSWECGSYGEDSLGEDSLGFILSNPFSASSSSVPFTGTILERPVFSYVGSEGQPSTVIPKAASSSHICFPEVRAFCMDDQPHSSRSSTSTASEQFNNLLNTPEVHSTGSVSHPPVADCKATRQLFSTND